MATYTEVISRAITDFDNIYDALKNKLVTTSQGALLTTAGKTDGTNPTSQYAGFIGQLYRVGVATTSGNTVTSVTGVTPTLTDGVIRSYAGEQVSAASGTYGTASTSTIPVTFYIPHAGYYDTTTTINGTTPIANIELTGQSIGDYTSGSNYTVQNLTAGEPNGTPMMYVTIPHGAVSVTYGQGAQTIQSEQISSDVTIKSQGTTATVASFTQGDSTDYTVVLNKSATYIAAGQINPTVQKTAGFIVDGDVSVATPEFNISATMTAQDKVLYIPKGTISGSLSSNAAVGITSDTISTMSDSAPASGTYYTLTAGTSNLNVLGTTTAGYVPTQTTPYQIGTVKDITKPYYIPAATIPDTNVELSQTQLTHSTGVELSSTTTNYPITYGVNVETITKPISDGYAKDEEYTVDISGTKTIYLKEASVSSGAAIRKDAYQGDTSIITEGTSGEYKVALKLTPTASASLTTEGYIGSSSQLHPTNGSQVIYNFSIAKASGLRVTPTLSAQLHNDTTASDGAASTEGDVVFSSTQPESGDYYTIAVTTDKQGTAGYIQNLDQIQVDSVAPKYLKKATFRYVEMQDGETSFLEVTSAGYVPSGRVAGIAEISGSIDTAAVTIGYTNADDILLASQPAANSGIAYYTISPRKNGVNAGYISDSQGTVAGDAYIAHGTASLVTDVPSTEYSVGALATNSYPVTLTHTVSNTLTLTEGYIKQADVTLNGEAGVLSKSITDTTTISLPKAVIAVKEKSLSTTATFADAITLGTSTSDGYLVTAKASGNFKTYASEGYIKAADSESTVSLANSDFTEGKYYIKKGTGPVKRTGYNNANNWSTAATTPVSGNITDSNNFNVDPAPATNYTITLGGYVDASLTLNEGYYGSSEKSLSGRVNVNKTLNVKRGHATATLNLTTNTLDVTSGSGETVSFENSVTGTNYIAIQSLVAYGAGITVNTEGYIRDISGDKSTADASAGQTKYLLTPLFSTATVGKVKKYDNVTYTATSNTVYTGFTIGSNDGDISGTSSYGTSTADEANLRDGIIIPTKNRFALYDTKVTLTANAMGSNVKAQLEKLNKRLAGQNTES